jgi:hypothetical protein
MPVSPNVVVFDDHQRIHRLDDKWVLGPIFFEPPPAQGSTAELTVAFQPYTYRLLIEIGSRVWMGDSFLAVTHLSNPRVELGWVSAPHAVVVGVQTVEPTAAPNGVLYALGEQGFYRLQGGKVLGVGNIGGMNNGPLSVGLECFPSDFERNQAQRHDRNIRLAKDGTMPGPLCQATVVDLKAGDASHRGEVTVFVPQATR